jgi:integrase/recombinase XerD
MAIHNYAKTTTKCRYRYLGYLGYFVCFARAHGVEDANEVTLELLLSYQRDLFAHRKADGEPLSFGTQAQRLVPTAQFFAWLRRQHRIATNSATDLLMPRLTGACPRQP